MRLTITQPSPGHLTIDVPHAFAVNARVFVKHQREEFALQVADAVTLDAWVVLAVRPKRGVANSGFVAHLVVAP